MPDPKRKLDLLSECNDQHVPPNDFKQTFCKRCRNPTCVNAGWQGSNFQERISTQKDRLIINPQFASPEDHQFDPFRAMHFLEVAAEALSIRSPGSDSWDAPGVHLASPDQSTNTSQVVEDAVSKLNEARGKPAKPAKPVKERLPPAAPEPERVLKPVVKPLSAETRVANTAFPDEGVMLDGSPPPSPVGAARGALVAVDPWAPVVVENKVPVGAKIKMGQ